jgi:hypothetical protein
MAGTPESAELHRRRRTKNIALAGVLLALVTIFYVVTVVRMGGQ